MTNAYQNFLDFFSMKNRERLDGLNEVYFEGMAPEERSRAFDYLLNMVKDGGSRETVGGLFIADAQRAAPIVGDLLFAGRLHEDAAIAAAWNLNRLQPAPALIAVFIGAMSSADKVNRANAAFYAPADAASPELLEALKGMIRTETETLPLVNATNKLLECCGITRESVDKETFSMYYCGLRSDLLADKEMTFKKLDDTFA